MKIFVKISKGDELNFRNLFSEYTPKLVTNDPGMDFITDEKLYNQDERIKIRIITSSDWGGVDWKT